MLTALFCCVKIFPVSAIQRENMLSLIRAIIVIVFLIPPVFQAYALTGDKIEPIAQVYEVQGEATLTNASDGEVAELKKGCLVAKEDYLTLERNAAVSLYFKSGGKKEVQAKNEKLSYKVADLMPKVEAYGQTVPLFGATRSRDIQEPNLPAAGFFYPQQTVIVDRPPLIEIRVFGAGDESSFIDGGVIEVLQDGAVMDSREIEGLQFGSVYAYENLKLKGGAEYNVEIELNLQKILGSVMTISFPFYIAEGDDKTSVLKYAPFKDSLYRSFEYTSVDYGGRNRAISLIKQLTTRGESSQPVILIELFLS